MELRHLRYFVTVAEELNFSRAAARLRVSQPAISRQIKDLEEEAGVQLFARESSGLKLTPAGQTFLAHARDVLRRGNEALKAMAAFRAAPAEKLVIGYIPTALPSFLSDALRAFAAEHPKVSVELRELSPKRQITELRSGKIDLAFIGHPCPELADEFDLRILKRIPLAMAIPDRHHLALRKKVSLHEFSDEDFIGLDEEHFPGRNAFICQTAQQAGFTPRIKHKADSLASLLALVGAARGVALVPKELESLPHRHAAIIPLKNSPSLAWSAAAQKEASALARRFISILRT